MQVKSGNTVLIFNDRLIVVFCIFLSCHEVTNNQGTICNIIEGTWIRKINNTNTNICREQRVTDCSISSNMTILHWILPNGNSGSSWYPALVFSTSGTWNPSGCSMRKPFSSAASSPAFIILIVLIHVVGSYWQFRPIISAPKMVKALWCDGPDMIFLYKLIHQKRARIGMYIVQKLSYATKNYNWQRAQ